MSGLFGGGKSVSNKEEVLAGIQVMTSCYGGVVPVVFGTTRVPANLIYLTDFTPVPHTDTQKTGKGGGGSTITNTSYTYTAAVILAVCEGPIDNFGYIWRDKDRFEAKTITMPNGVTRVVYPQIPNSTLYMGNIPQSVWPYLTSKHPDDALAYSGTAILANSAIDLGSSGSMKNHSFEVISKFRDAANGKDALLSTVLWEVLTNARYGMAWASSRIHPSAFANFAAYCRAANIRVSPAFKNQKPGIEWLNDLLTVGNAGAVWSMGQYKFIPYQDTAVGDWTPNSTPEYDLGPDDFIVEGPDDDPVKVNRTTLADAYNRVQVEYLNRERDYNTDLAQAADLADIENFGPRSADPVKLEMITEPEMAQDTAHRILQRKLHIRNEYEFVLGPKHMLLEGMDLVTLTDDTLGLVKKPCRIEEIEDDEDGKRYVKAKEWPFGVATATRYPTPKGTGGGSSLNDLPGSVTAACIFEPPGDLTGGLMEVWIGAAGGEKWGGCEVWASRDGDSYVLVGIVNQPARVGSVTTPLTGDSFGVDIRASRGVLSSVSAVDAAALATRSYVGGEILSYQTAALGAEAGLYTLSTLKRRLFGTDSINVGAGSQFLLLDGAVARIPADRWTKGDKLKIKLVSFNSLGLMKEDIAEIEPISYTITGRANVWKAPDNVVLSIVNAPGGATSGSGGSAGGSSSMVSITPTTATVGAGGTVQFRGNVTGVSNNFLLFTATGGQFQGIPQVASGSPVTWVAPTAPGVYTVTAISVADINARASATVTVTAAAQSLSGELTNRVVREVAAPGSASGTITSSSQTLGSLSTTNPVRRADFYKFSIETRRAVSITLQGGTIPEGTQMDTYLYLFRNDSTIITENDDFQGVSSRIDITLDPGLYVVAASTFAQDVFGAYTLTVN